MTLKPFG